MSAMHAGRMPVTGSSMARTVTFLSALLVALVSGTNYVFSVYGPQLGERLNLSHIKLNVIGLAGSFGVYSAGPFWGKLIDRRGPKIPLSLASFLLFTGYLGLRSMYIGGLAPEQSTASTFTFFAMFVCTFMTGVGGNAGHAASTNTVAKSFPEALRTSVTACMSAGVGLSAFIFSSIAHYVFPGDTAALLLTLGLGTAISALLGSFFVRVVPPTGPKDIFDEDVDAMPLLANEDVDEGRVEMRPIRSMQSLDTPNLNIHGGALWCNVDFWLLVVILSCLSGTGLMYINNVGAMSQALYAASTAAYSPVEAATWQAAQVSTVSVSNCLGRIFIGVLSDFCKHRLDLARPNMLIVVSCLVLLSQIIASVVEDVQSLWMASVALGLAYGSTFGLLPALAIDYFGIVHFSENWGYISLSPLIGGNIFSIAFGRNLDAHQPHDKTGKGSNQCLEGKECYVQSFHLTMAGCVLALSCSVYTAWRGGHLPRIRRRIDMILEK